MAKWADYCISEVSYNKEKTHIVQVKAREDQDARLGPEMVVLRTKIVELIEKGYTFVTIRKNAAGTYDKGEDVRKVKINGKDYIRTDANNTEKDNLGNLPEF